MGVLTADSLHGRGYFEDGLSKASAWLGGQMDSLGLSKLPEGRWQNFTFPVNTFPGEITLKVKGKYLKPGVDFIVDPGSPSFKGTLQLNQKKHLPARVYYTDTISNVDRKLKAQEQMFAAAQVHPVIHLRKEKLTWSVAREQNPWPIVEVLQSSWPKLAKKASLRIESTLVPDFAAANVIGSLAGRQDSLIVFTAHYDHLGRMGPDAIFPGANDNASGIALMLDLARHFATTKPNYTLLFVAFAGEEAGLVGSRFFVENSPVNLDKIKAVINLDLMGSAEKGITVVNGKAHPQWIEQLGRINEERQLLPTIKVRGHAPNSDHFWFVEAGVPAIFIYTVGNISAYHDVHDTNSNVGWEGYASLFRLIAYFVEDF